ncbi:MAG: glycosyltransferase family 2 protein [Gemmatimonadaceae bacterium]|nr:glycosyltransferase family 2 protein [Gloeobacterales cyanobacterium ES-bin-141]
MNTVKVESISIVIPVKNGGEAFRHCLAHIKAYVPPSIEVIIVADGDTGESLHLAQASGVQVLSTPQTSGPATARNLGARAARGDILFFVDADVAIGPDTLARVGEIFAQEPELAAVIGSYDDEPGAPNFLSQYKNLFHHHTHQIAREEACTFWGACGAIRREVFLALGGFDECYRRPSIEDIELGYRLKRAGHRIRLLKTLQVKHLKRWDTGSLLKADIFYRAVPWVNLILREGRMVNDLNLRLSSRLSVMMVYLLVGTLLVSLGWIEVLALTAVLSCSLLLLNAPTYRFFKRKRGLWFAVQTVPWHWMYFFYSGLAFSLGLANHVLRRRDA